MYLKITDIPLTFQLLNVIIEIEEVPYYDIYA